MQEILLADDGDWYISGGGLSFQKERIGSSHTWTVPNGGVINDVTLLNESVMVAHSEGLSEIFSNKDLDPIHHKKGEEVLVAAILEQDLPDLPSTIFSIDYLSVGQVDYIAVKHLLGSEVHRYEDSQWVQENISGDWLHYDGGVLVGDSQGWQTLDGISSPNGWDAHRNGYLIDNNTLHKFNGITTQLTEINANCNGLSFGYDGQLLCSTDGGSLVIGETLSPRLPFSVDILCSLPNGALGPLLITSFPSTLRYIRGCYGVRVYNP